MKSQIEFNDVVKKYNKNIALNGMSFTISTNEFVALVGNNGCGKTTTINVLSNLITYDRGDVFVFNKKVTPNYISYKNQIGVLLSQSILITEFTPVEYLQFVCKFQKVDHSQVRRRIDEIISVFELVSVNNKKINDYSSGDQMKISFAAAIIHNPSILILDEPFIHLDIKTIDFIMNLLISFKNTKTVFVSSHNLDLVLNLCDKFLVMEKGKIIDDFLKRNFSSNDNIKTVIKERLLINKVDINNLNWLN